MKILGPVISLLFAVTAIAFSGLACQRSVASAGPAPQVATPRISASDAGKPAHPAMAPVAPATLEVVKQDTFQQSLLDRLKKSGTSAPTPNPAGVALANTFVKPLPNGVTVDGPVKCYGEAHHALFEKRQAQERARFDKAKTDDGRKDVLSNWPIQGCTVDVRYGDVSSVVALDETIFRNRDSSFNRWTGSNGRTAPRWDKTQHRNAIVTTWYFLQPPPPNPYGGIEPTVICKLFGNCP